jgi:AcrR family transcriptional regulator
MALSANKRRSAAATSVTRDRVMEAAEEMILAGEFAQASVTELAEKAEVSRATVFSRFGSKLGVLEALAVRCSGSSQILAIRAAAELADPAEAVTAIVQAGCDHWELQAHILVTLKAVSELEPGAVSMVEDQNEDQRSTMDRLAKGLERESRLNGLTRAQAAAALHMITSVESFIQLRRNGGLSLASTKAVLGAAVDGLFDLRPR